MRSKLLAVIGIVFSVGSLFAMAKRPEAVTQYTDCSTVTDSRTGTCKSNPACATGKSCHTANYGCKCVSETIKGDPVVVPTESNKIINVM